MWGRQPISPAVNGGATGLLRPLIPLDIEFRVSYIQLVFVTAQNAAVSKGGGLGLVQGAVLGR
jgi:hypothetical protein